MCQGNRGFSMVEDHVKLTRDLLQVRIMLEPQIAGLAAQRAKEEDIEELASILREMELVMEKRRLFGPGYKISHENCRMHS